VYWPAGQLWPPTVKLKGTLMFDSAIAVFAVKAKAASMTGARTMERSVIFIEDLLPENHTTRLQN
jgi:hypothetical protein